MVLLLTATAFLGGFEKQQDRISYLTTFKNSFNKGILNQWYGPVNSTDQRLYNYRTLDIDQYELFPDYARNESKQLDLNDEYTNSIIKALLELSDLPEPEDDQTNEKYVRGPFYHPKYTQRFTIFRSKNQKYKTQVVEDGTMNASARKKRFREDDGRIVGGVSSLQFSYVNHKFSSTPPGRTKRMIADDTRDEEEDFNPGSSKIGDKEMTKEEGLRIVGGESSLQFANENHKFRNVLPLRIKRFAEDDVGDEEEDDKKGGANARGKDKTTGGGGRIVGGTSSLQHANVNYKFRSALPGRMKRFAEDDVGDEEEDAKNDGSKTGGKDTTKGDGGRIVGGTSSLQHANVNYKFRSALPGRMKRSTEDDVGDEEEDAKKGGANSKGKDKTTGGGGRIVGGTSSLQHANVNHKFRSALPGRMKRSTEDDVGDEEEDAKKGGANTKGKDKTTGGGGRIVGGTSSLQHANVNYKFRSALPGRMKRFAEDDVGDEEEDAKNGGSKTGGKDTTKGDGGRIVGGTSSLQHANVNYKFRSALPGRMKRSTEDDVGDEEEDDKNGGSKTGGKDTTKGDGGRIVGGTSSLQHANVNYKFRSALPGRMKRSTEDDVGDEEEDAKKGGSKTGGKDTTKGDGGRIVGGTSSLQHANVNYKFRSALPGRMKRYTEDDVGDEEEDAKNGGSKTGGKDTTKGDGGRIVGGTSSLQHANVNYKFRSALPGRMKRSTEDDVGDEEEDAKKGGSKTGGKDTTKGDGGRIVGGTSSLQHANVKYKFRSGLPGRTKRFLNIGNGEVGSKTGGKNPTKGGVGRIIGGISSLIHSNVNQKFKSAFPG